MNANDVEAIRATQATRPAVLAALAAHNGQGQPADSIQLNGLAIPASQYAVVMDAIVAKHGPWLPSEANSIRQAARVMLLGV